MWLASIIFRKDKERSKTTWPINKHKHQDSSYSSSSSIPTNNGQPITSRNYHVLWWNGSGVIEIADIPLDSGVVFPNAAIDDCVGHVFIHRRPYKLGIIVVNSEPSVIDLLCEDDLVNGNHIAVDVDSNHCVIDKDRGKGGGRDNARHFCSVGEFCYQDEAGVNCVISG